MDWLEFLEGPSVCFVRRDGDERRRSDRNFLLADEADRGCGGGVRSLGSAELWTREGGQRGEAGEDESRRPCLHDNTDA